MTRTEKWSIGLSLVATVVSVIALAASVWQYEDRKQFDQQARESYLDARVGAVTQGLTQFTVNGVSDRILFRQQFRCVLTNNGYAPTSVVEWRVVELAKPSPNSVSTGEGGYWYIGMDPKLLNAEGQEVNLPVRFEPGESKVFFIEVAMVVPEAAWLEVRDAIPLNQQITWTKADSIFSAANHPMFGQVSRVPIRGTGPQPIHTYVSDPDYQEFLAFFVKGNGNQARAQFSIMGNDAYLQQADEEAINRP